MTSEEFEQFKIDYLAYCAQARVVNYQKMRDSLQRQYHRDERHKKEANSQLSLFL